MISFDANEQLMNYYCKDKNPPNLRVVGMTEYSCNVCKHFNPNSKICQKFNDPVNADETCDDFVPYGSDDMYINESYSDWKSNLQVLNNRYSSGDIDSQKIHSMAKTFLMNWKKIKNGVDKPLWSDIEYALYVLNGNRKVSDELLALTKRMFHGKEISSQFGNLNEDKTKDELFNEMITILNSALILVGVQFGAATTAIFTTGVVPMALSVTCMIVFLYFVMCASLGVVYLAKIGLSDTFLKLKSLFVSQWNGLSRNFKLLFLASRYLDRYRDTNELLVIFSPLAYSSDLNGAIKGDFVNYVSVGTKVVVDIFFMNSKKVASASIANIVMLNLIDDDNVVFVSKKSLLGSLSLMESVYYKKEEDQFLCECMSPMILNESFWRWIKKYGSDGINKAKEIAVKTYRKLKDKYVDAPERESQRKRELYQKVKEYQEIIKKAQVELNKKIEKMRDDFKEEEKKIKEQFRDKEKEDLDQLVKKKEEEYFEKRSKELEDPFTAYVINPLDKLFGNENEHSMLGGLARGGGGRSRQVKIKKDRKGRRIFR